LNDPNLHLLTRDGTRGYAAASRDGFAWCLDRDIDIMITMDCDLSHDPAALAAIIDRASGGADLVIGSRYVDGGSINNWPLHRRLLSRWGNRYTAAMLRLPFTDCTSGFRAYRRSCLEAILAAGPSADGYAFLTETLRIVAGDSRWFATETPITFTDRTRGRSKMSLRIVLESIVLVTRWGVRLRLRGIPPG
jgi:dolichol-phosphate mannosyltransferase